MKKKLSKEDRALLKIYAAIKTVRRGNRLSVLRAARSLVLITGLAA